MRKEIKPIILLACWLALINPGFPPSRSDTAAAPYARVVKTQIGPTGKCIPESDLGDSLITLKSHLSGDELFRVSRELLRNAKRSPECRSRVIQALMTAMKQPGGSNGLGGVDSETYSLWQNGADLLANLQATEAVDLLIAHLDLTDGLTATLGHHPAIGAVIRIGHPAIPKLEEVLSKNPQPYMRRFAVFCIASIGGTRAKNALAKALPGETDHCVKSFISASLEMFDNKRYPNQIPPERNGSWYSMVYCSTEGK